MNHKYKKTYKSKLTPDKKVETTTMIMMLILLILQTAYGDKSEMGKITKNLISYLILCNLAVSTFKSVKSAVKNYNKLIKIN
jgi:uncharacterized membrane protein